MPIRTTRKAEREKLRKFKWKQAGYKPSREVVPTNQQHIACIRPADQSRPKFLLSSGAFDDIRDPSNYLDKQQDLQQLLNAWVEDNEDCRVYRQPKSRAALKHDTNRYKIPDVPRGMRVHTIQSDERATLVIDQDNAVLAYKFRIPEDLHQRLVESDLFLSQAKRANYSLWAKSTDEIAMSSDYRRHLPESENFFEHNRELWNVLDDVLRLLDPVMYQKYTNVDQFLKGDEKRLAGAWHGAIINRQTGSKEEAVPHKNWKDWGKGLTAMIPWGDYDGGDVQLYNLGLRFEMKPCDVLLVNARCVSYGVQEVTKGMRNELDLVVQGTTIKWRHEKVTNGALKRADERKRMERERRKKDKQRTPLGRSVIGGTRREAKEMRPPTVRLPTSPSSNAVALGTRGTEGQEANKTEKDSASTLGPAKTNSHMRPLNTPAGDVIAKVLRDRVVLEAANKLATANVSPPEINPPTSKNKAKARRRLRAERLKNAAEEAIMGTVPTEGKSPQQIDDAKHQAVIAHQLKEKTGRKAMRIANRAVRKAAYQEQALASGKALWEIKQAVHAETMEMQGIEKLNRKNKKKESRAEELQKAAAAMKGAAALPTIGKGKKRKGDQEDGTRLTKKQRVALGKAKNVAKNSTVNTEKVPAPKSEPAAPMIKRENVNGKMREVVCLD